MRTNPGGCCKQLHRLNWDQLIIFFPEPGLAGALKNRMFIHFIDRAFNPHFLCFKFKDGALYSSESEIDFLDLYCH